MHSAPERITSGEAPLTERSRAVHAVGPEEEALAERDRLEDGAPLAHQVLLLLYVLDPLALAHVRACPQRHLVVLPAQVHERDREAALALLHGNRGRVRRVLQQLLLLLILRLARRELVRCGDQE